VEKAVTIETVIKPAVELRDLARLASEIASRPDLSELLPATPGVRTWTSLDTPNGWDAWLIAWPEGSDTGWHDHQGSAGVFAVAQGSLTEFSVSGSRLAIASSAGSTALPGDIAANSGDVRTQRIDAGTPRTFGPKHIHHVVNEHPLTAYSVHVYAPRLRGMSRYQWEDDALVLTALEVAGTWQG
jgi:Cysteine dioxygenase type I